MVDNRWKKTCSFPLGRLWLMLLAFAGFVSLTMEARSESANLQTLSHHVPSIVRDLHSSGRLPASKRLKLAVSLPLRNKSDLTNLLQQLYDPSNTNYHHYLKPAQFAGRFGPALADYEALKGFATAHNFAVTGTHPNRTLLDVEGSVADIEKAFHTKMRVYRHPTEQRDFFAPDTEPSIDLNVPVLHISGLDNFMLPRAMNHQMPPRPPGAKPAGGSAPGGNYMGNDFRAAYAPGVTLTGAGQTVGLLEFDSGYVQSDITAYENLAGLPNVPVNAVLLDGYDGSQGEGNDEVSLDIEMAISMAPGLAGVVVYEGSVTDDILNRMATDNLAKQIGASWAAYADEGSDQIFQQFATQGQSFFNACGDGDAWIGPIWSPCDDPNITVVGGTTLSTSGPAGSWTTEQVWNWGYDPPGWYPGDDYWGGGGGVSTYWPIPSWQLGINMVTNHGSTAMRNVPDVAMTANQIWVVYGGGATGEFGGTSCATPLWAGFLALVNQQAAANGQPSLGFINPALYSIGRGPDYTSCFHDIMIGNNIWTNSAGEFMAVPGFDLCTGWGTPAGQALIDALASDALSLSPESGLSASGPLGGPFAHPAATIVLSNRSGSSLTWTCVNTSPWLTVAPTNGTLAPGQNSSAVVMLSPSANALAAGVYTAALWFTNLTDGIVQSRQNLLLVNPVEHLGFYAGTLLSFHPAAYWPLNETNVPPAADVATNAGSLGFIANGFGFDGVGQGQAGIVSNCFSFNNPDLDIGALNNYVDVPNNPALNPNGPFTVEFWANPNQSPDDYFSPVCSVDSTQNGGGSRFGWLFYEAAGDQWVFRLGNISGYIAAPTGGTVQPGVWQQVVGVYDGTNASLYVNGALAAGPASAAGFAPNANPTVPLRIGATTLDNRTFDGLVDELAVYTNALTSNAISAHYHAASTNNSGYAAQILASHPTGYWHLDEPAYNAPAAGALPMAFNLGSLSYLADGIYEPGSIPGVAGVPLAGFGSPNLACGFVASSYIDVSGAWLDFTGGMTLSAWVKIPASAGQTQSILSKGAGSYELSLDGLGRPRFAAGSQAFGDLIATNIIDDNQWHQLTGVYDGTNTESLYVDGRLSAQSTNAVVSPVVNADDFWIGGDPDPGAFQFFNGVIDEAAIFTNALSSSQILWLFSSGSDATLLTALKNSPASSAITLTWAAIPGEKYLVEYSTNLSQQNWSALGLPAAATNATSSITVNPGPASPLFYRVLLVP